MNPKTGRWLKGDLDTLTVIPGGIHFVWPLPFEIELRILNTYTI